MKPVVLVVDDNPDNRDLYTRYLAFHGHAVEGAEDGMEALALAVVHRPAVIVMDLGLPRLDGWEAIRMLRSRSEPPTSRSWRSART